jgi:hypothetical protein
MRTQARRVGAFRKPELCIRILIIFLKLDPVPGIRIRVKSRIRIRVKSRIRIKVKILKL